MVKADKTHKVVIMTKSQYNEKISKIISNKTEFFKQRLDPTKDINNKVIKFVEKLIKKKMIKEKDKWGYLNIHGGPPRISGLVKLHKEGFPVRCIVDGSNSISKNQSKNYKKFLESFCNNNPYDVKNALDLKSKLGNVKLSENEELVSRCY